MTDHGDGERPAESARSWTVLINDHYGPTFDGLFLTLERAGLNVIGSSSTDENIDLLKVHNVDGAVLDLDAPDRSMPLADIFMKNFVPFFFIGGLEGEDFGVHDGVRNIIKPFSRDELLSEVNKMLKGAGREA